LENADRIVGAKDGHGAGQSDATSAFCSGGEDYGWGRGQVVSPMVFADAKDVQSDLIGQCNFFNSLSNASCCTSLAPGSLIVCNIDESTNAEFHGHCF